MFTHHYPFSDATHADVQPTVARSPRHTDIIGRGMDLQVAYHAVQHSATRLLTFTGTGGVGKSHLACSIAESCAGYFKTTVTVSLPL